MNYQPLKKQQSSLFTSFGRRCTSVTATNLAGVAVQYAPNPMKQMELADGRHQQ